MKFLQIFGGLVILVFNLVVSFYHSLQLFRAGGYTGVHAYLAVGAIEILFLVCAFTIIANRIKGTKPSTFTKAGGVIGVGVVMWSNIHAGIDYGITGIILGALIPLTLVVAEGVVSSEIITKSPAAKSTTKEAPGTSTNFTTKEEVTSTNKLVSTNETTNLVTTNTTNNDSTSTTTKKTNVVEITKNTSTRNSTNGNSTNKQKKSTTRMDLAPIREAAIKYQQEHGKLPGRTLLQRLTGCRENHARIVLDELKQGA